MSALKFLAACTLLLASASMHASTYSDEPAQTGWAFYMDNDILALRSTDRDYTGGMSLTLAGSDAQSALVSVDPVRAVLDQWTGFSQQYRASTVKRHSLEFGLTIFTPQDLVSRTHQAGDRPYASLLYLANTEVNVLPEQELAYISSFTLGILAAPGVDGLQTGLHEALGSEQPNGWERQISDGGELTARYSMARTKRVWDGQMLGGRGEITTTSRLSVGYLTEASFGIAGRLGATSTPWWSYNPQLAEYAEKTVPIAAAEGLRAEHYFWAGFNLRARAYNAFLQGQFRSSEVTFSADDLRPLVLETWLGYTIALNSGWRYAYELRALSSEIESGPSDRTMVWGGLVVSQSF